jgi:hypothetical protein
VNTAPSLFAGFCGAIFFFVLFPACLFYMLAAHGFALGRAYVRVLPVYSVPALVVH